MSVEFRITKGARAGASERFEKSVITIGRHPMNDLRFDPSKDLDVSSRHAELRSVGDRHVLHDIGSTNGTFVNGERITGERQLADGDVVGFGIDGPQVTFHSRLGAEAAVSAPATRVERPSPAAASAAIPSVATPRSTPSTPSAAATHAPAPDARPRKNTEVRVAEAVAKQTGTLRQMVGALAALVVIGGAVAIWVTMRTTSAARQQVSQLIAANDSLARSLESRLAQTGMADSALKAARAETERLTRELRTRQAEGGDVTALSAEMRLAQARTANIARMDYSAVTEANKAAVVFIAVQMPDGSASSGTGFNILPSGLIVTNRHVVQTSKGVRAQQVGVAFDDTQGQWKVATIEYVSTTDELALLRLVRPGNYPVVSGIAGEGGAVRLGDPVAILGYPLGTSTAGMGDNIDDLRPLASLGIGTVSKILADNIQLDAFAAQGSSGSPVFDSRGLVVGVLFGAAAESGGRIIYSVPGARLAAQLPTDAAGVIR